MRCERVEKVGSPDSFALRKLMHNSLSAWLTRSLTGNNKKLWKTFPHHTLFYRNWLKKVLCLNQEVEKSERDDGSASAWCEPKTFVLSCAKLCWSIIEVFHSVMQIFELRYSFCFFRSLCMFINLARKRDDVLWKRLCGWRKMWRKMLPRMASQKLSIVVGMPNHTIRMTRKSFHWTPTVERESPSTLILALFAIPSKAISSFHTKGGTTTLKI